MDELVLGGVVPGAEVVHRTEELLPPKSRSVQANPRVPGLLCEPFPSIASRKPARGTALGRIYARYRTRCRAQCRELEREGDRPLV